MRLTNNQAALVMVFLVSLQLAALFSILQLPFKTPGTGYAVGQVLGIVQSEPPDNYRFEADAANDVYLGTPAYRLASGQVVSIGGNESDLNGYEDVSANSQCAWSATGYSTTSVPAFTSCNSTDCSYACELTLSALTPSGYYNVTANITDNAGAYSEKSKLVYVYPFEAVVAAYTGSGSGGDVILLRLPTPTPFPGLPTPSVAASASPSASPAPTGVPTAVPEKFGLQVVLPELINKCEIADARVVVRNENDASKSVTLEFEGKTASLYLNPRESRSVYFKIRAPRMAVPEAKEFTAAARLYYNARKAAEAEGRTRLLLKSTDICVFQTPEKRFVPLAGKNSTFKIDLVIATYMKGETMEVESTKEGRNLFLDLADPNEYYYDNTFYVFETGVFDFRARLRSGLKTVDEKLEKVRIG